MRDYKFIEDFEKNNNVVIKPYRRQNLLKMYFFSGRNSVVFIPNKKLFGKPRDWSSQKVVIHVYYTLLDNLPNKILEGLFFHEIGHIRGNGRRSEIFADIYAMENCGLSPDEYWLNEVKIICFLKFGTTNLNQLPKIKELPLKTRFKLAFGLKSLTDYI